MPFFDDDSLIPQCYVVMNWLPMYLSDAGDPKSLKFGALKDSCFLKYYVDGGCFSE